MCGICGIVCKNDLAQPENGLQTMVKELTHRGPDGSGVYTEGACGLGHTRLSIIDLSSAGSQPMYTTDRRYAITYNGEIYNYRELKTELEAKGFVFRSVSDTEVVLNAYIAWGDSCVTRFNGMFAFAIWDATEKSLFLARDRYGIKPLYYSCNDVGFLFASEHKAFLKHPTFSRELDMEAIFEYFTFQNIFTDKTFFKSIRTFPAGFTGRIHAGNTFDLKLNQYWDYSFEEPETIADEREYQEELDRLFKQAVNRQLVSDVEVSTYLSGGIDSGSITAIAAKTLPHMKSFTCGFDMSSSSGLELAYDEREKAEFLSYCLKTEHYEMVLKAGDMERCLPRLVWHLEEPRIGQSYPNYYAAHLASKFCKVVLAGTGGDELFGGYPWRYYRAVNCSRFDNYVDQYFGFWQRLIPSSSMQQVFSPVWNQVSHINAKDIFRNVFQHQPSKICHPVDYINHSLYFEAKTFLHGLFAVEDKLSMAHGLETRVPFMDNDLVDFALKLPVGMKLGKLKEVASINENEPHKLHKYYQKTRDGKKLLRQLFSNYVPEEISNGVKQGFSGPDSSWFKGESIEYVRNVVYNDNSRIYSVLDRDSVRSLVSTHLDGKDNRRLFIWSLLVFEEWLKTYA